MSSITVATVDGLHNLPSTVAACSTARFHGNYLKYPTYQAFFRLNAWSTVCVTDINALPFIYTRANCWYNGDEY